MRRRLYIAAVLAVVTLGSMAQTIGEAFYIYRNDGGFNAFFRDEVDSIAYSHYDQDSLYYDENVTQLVYTLDSIYRIPLAAIDSVGFVTPETVYKPGIIKLEEYLNDYLVSVNADTLVFALSMPANIVPHVGDRLVTLEMSDFFPLGFAGEVVKVNVTADAIDVIYEDIELTDAFDCLFVTSKDSPAKSRAHRLDWHGSTTLTPGPFAFGKWTESVASELDVQKDYAFTFSPELSFTYTPKLWVSGMIIITKEIGHYFSFTCTGEHELVEHVAATGNLSWEKKAGINVPAVRLPVCPFLQLFFEPGLFFKAESELSASLTFTQRFNTALHYEWNSKGQEVGKNVATVRSVSNDMSGEAMFKGSISAGAYFDVGVQAFNRPYMKKQNKNWGSLRAQLEMGWVAESNAVLEKVETELAKASTALYEQLKNSALTFSKYWGTSVTFQPVPWLSLTTPLPFGNKEEIGRLGHVPAFEQTSIERDGDNSDILIAKTHARGTLFRPVGVGFALQDKNGNDVDSYLFDTEYRNQNIPLEHAFVPPANSEFTVYPVVRWNGIEMLAEPKAKETFSCLDDNHPHVIDLGLPSGTRWYCCNFGADTPEGWGGYYAFAELSEKNTYTLSNYLYYYDGGQYSYFESIGGNIPNFGVSISGKMGYDVVTQNWGEESRMPTKAEVQELIDKCTWTWTFRNEVPGYEVTGPNGNSIFLPASGQKTQTVSYQGDSNRLTYYRTGEWSSRQWSNQGFGYTWAIRFKEGSYELTDACAKAFGYVIRPVGSNRQ